MKNELDQVRRSFVFLVLFRKFIGSNFLVRTSCVPKSKVCWVRTSCVPKWSQSSLGSNPQEMERQAPLFKEKIPFLEKNTLFWQKKCQKFELFGKFCKKNVTFLFVCWVQTERDFFLNPRLFGSNFLDLFLAKSSLV